MLGRDQELEDTSKRWMQMLSRFSVPSTRQHFCNQECRSVDLKCARDSRHKRDVPSRSESQQSFVARIGGITEDDQFEALEGWTLLAFSM
jgi:hypothetical protein